MSDKVKPGWLGMVLLTPILIFALMFFFSVGLGLSAVLDIEFRAGLDHVHAPNWIASASLLAFGSAMVLLAWRGRKRSHGTFWLCCAVTFLITIVLDVFDHRVAQHLNLF